MKKTTDKHFKIFRQECERLINVLGLQDWSIYFAHDGKEEDGRFGFTSTKYKSCVATVGLNKFWDADPRLLNEEAIKDVARHEIMHLLLARLYGLACERGVSIDELEKEEESVVVRLENILKNKI